ncbi:MAG TPA: nucleotidyltransferase domain-containing protein [Bacteroidetes bacterium]|nr:nucleotidyltransferase domain-containing protein [Bacteroidota bacterium]
MIEIKPYQNAIKYACQSQGVKKLELFGSYAREDFRADSDMDFLVEFDLSQPSLFDRYLALFEALEKIFKKKIDLVEISSLKNAILIKSINEDRKVIYEA